MNVFQALSPNPLYTVLHLASVLVNILNDLGLLLTLPVLMEARARAHK